MSAEPKQTSPDSAADDQYELRVTHAANRTGDCKGRGAAIRFGRHECPLRASITFVGFGAIIQDHRSSSRYLLFQPRTGVTHVLYSKWPKP
jgi:hypothetical protein